MKARRRLRLPIAVDHGTRSPSSCIFTTGAPVQLHVMLKHKQELSYNSLTFSGRKGTEKQFLGSPATFRTFVALQMIKPGSGMWLQASNLRRDMKPVYLQSACSSYLTQTFQFCEIIFVLKQLSKKKASKKWTDWCITRGTCISLLPRRFLSCPLLGGMPQHAVL